MKSFPPPLLVGFDAAGCPRIAFDFDDMAIVDPTVSECRRFAVEPSSYGLSAADVQALEDLNRAVSQAASRALQAGRAELQAWLGPSKGAASARNLDDCPALWEILATSAIEQVNAARVPVLLRADHGQGVVAWAFDRPVRLGSVRIETVGPSLDPVVLDQARLRFLVFDQDGAVLVEREALGRAGLNELYLERVGYRPDEDDYEPDPLKLLARVTEVLYRHASGDHL